MNAILTAMLWCAIQVTVLACSAMLVYLVARRLHPRAGAAAAGGALAMVLLLTALVVSPWPRWNFSTAGDEAIAAAATTAPTTIPNAAAKAPAGKDAVATPPRVQLDSPRRAFWSALLRRLNNPRPAPEAKPRSVGWGLVIAGIFGCGILVTAARFGWGIASVRRLARRACFVDDANVIAMASELQRSLQLNKDVAVRESDELATPATIGWRRPVVLLPAAWRSWSDDQLRAAIAHELAHIAGRDYAAWLVARLAVVAHFYHPLVHWLAARLQLEQELAADMTAARLVGDAKQYLHSLAALALATPPHRIAGPARTLIPSRSLLVRRVEMLRKLGIRRPRRPAARYATFAAVALFAVAAAGLRGANNSRH